MEHRGQQFGVNLFRLWEVAAIDLPAFATRFVNAGTDIAELGEISVTGGPGTAQVLAAWSQMAADLEGMLSDSLDNTYAAADALLAIVNAYAYADSDAAAKNEFNARRSYEITKHQNDPNMEIYDDPSYRPQIMGN